MPYQDSEKLTQAQRSFLDAANERDWTNYLSERIFDVVRPLSPSHAERLKAKVRST